MKRLIGCIMKLIILFTLPISYVQADAPDYSCRPVGGVHVFNFDNAEKTITEIDKNKAGTIITDAFQFNLGGTYSTTGCGIRAPGYITTTSDLPVIGQNSAGGNWYQVNDYLGIAMQGYIAGNVRQYIAVPFISKSNEMSTSNQFNWESGSKGKVSIKILRPFIGFSHFSKVIMHTQIARTPNVGASGPYVSEVLMSGQIVVPQSCELNAGQVITMDFGNIAASAFSQAGAGNKPDSVNPQTRSIGIKCKNIDAQALLSLRIEGNKVDGNALVSDNPDLGFVIGDEKHNPLTPNNINSRIPFTLDDSASATVPISAWPVSVTGNRPAEGRFTAEGYLRVDFN